MHQMSPTLVFLKYSVAPVEVAVGDRLPRAAPCGNSSGLVNQVLLARSPPMIGMPYFLMIGTTASIVSTWMLPTKASTFLLWIRSWTLVDAVDGSPWSSSK